MIKLILKRIRDNFSKTYLTFAAIIISIFFLSGSLIMKDSLKNAILTATSTEGKGTDITVYPDSIGSSNLSKELIEKIKNNSNVEKISGDVNERGHTVLDNDKDNKNLNVIIGDLNDRLILQGHKPTNNDELLIDDKLAKNNHVKLNDKITIKNEESQSFKKYTISGIFKQPLTLVPQNYIAMSDSAVKEYLHTDNIYTQVYINIKDKKNISETKQDINNLLEEYNKNLGDDDAKLKVSTTKAFHKQHDAVIVSGIDKLSKFMLFFAVLASAICTILIYNTFNILVMQEQKFFGLLRCIGVSRLKILLINLIYFIILGIVSSCVGIVLSALFPRLLYKFIGYASNSFIQIPKQIVNTLSITTEDIILSILFGVLITLISGIIPAIKASVVSPIAALKESVVLSVKKRKVINILRIIFACVYIFIIIFIALVSKRNSINMGIISGLIILTILTLNKFLVEPITKCLSWIGYHIFGRWIKSFGGLLNLAQSNIKNNSSKISSNTITLMIMTFLISFINIFIASGLKYIDYQIDKTIPYQYTMNINSKDTEQQVSNELKSISHFDYFSDKRASVIEGKEVLQDYSNSKLVVSSSFVKKMNDLFILKSGKLEDVHGDKIAANIINDRGKQQNYKIGSKITLSDSDGNNPHTFTIAALFKAKSDAVLSDYFVSSDTFDRYFAYIGSTIFLNKNKNISDSVANKDIKNIQNNHNDITIQSMKGIKDTVYSIINFIKQIIMGLLFMSILISFFGIATVISLSIIERKRELSLLRILGLTKLQMYFLLATEGVLMSLFAIGTGLIAAISLAYINLIPIMGHDIQFSIPYTDVLYMLLLAFMIGILSSLLPARSAIKSANVHNISE